jgi:radical SAM protein with 4Fe4S-binding SPASM domain
MVFVLLTGGEPFVRKDFFEIYGAMKKMGLLISINSNGSMLSGEIRRKLLEDPPFRINISLYGGCNDTYRTMCGLPAFDQVVENIRALKEGGVDVRINLSITPYNCGDLKKIWQISQELGVHVKAASYMYPPIRVNGQQFGCGNRLSPEDAAACGVAWDKLRFTEEEMDHRAQAMHRLARTEEPDCPTELENGVRCRAGSSAFWMTWDGKMMPCGMMPYPVAYPLEVGFADAWNQIMQETKAIRSPSKCASCSKKDVCSVCAAVCVTETGRFDAVPEYVCRMTEETVRQTWKDYVERKGIPYED